MDYHSLAGEVFPDVPLIIHKENFHLFVYVPHCLHAYPPQIANFRCYTARLYFIHSNTGGGSSLVFYWYRQSRSFLPWWNEEGAITTGFVRRMALLLQLAF